MLSIFLGPPCSGKTTTALRLAADLKDTGYPAEFLVEQARLHIARMRAEDVDALVTPDRQRRIMYDQWGWERDLSVDPRTIVVADSSVLNGLLYLPEEEVSPEVRAWVAWEIINADLIFRCPPVPPSVVQDPNRLHSLEVSRALDGRLDELVQQYDVKVIPLHGDTPYRVQQAYAQVLRKLL